MNTIFAEILSRHSRERRELITEHKLERLKIKKGHIADFALIPEGKEGAFMKARMLIRSTTELLDLSKLYHDKWNTMVERHNKELRK